MPIASSTHGQIEELCFHLSVSSSHITLCFSCVHARPETMTKSWAYSMRVTTCVIFYYFLLYFARRLFRKLFTLTSISYISKPKNMIFIGLCKYACFCFPRLMVMRLWCSFWSFLYFALVHKSNSCLGIFTPTYSYRKEIVLFHLFQRKGTR